MSGRARLVCRCMGVSSTRICAALAELAAPGLEALGEATGAGTVCGSCHSELEEILAEHAGRPWPEARVREVRRAGHAASLIRVESVLFHALVPRLPADTQLELISLEGLELSVHLHGEDTPELRALIEQRLRKLVCADIHVQFG